MKINIVGLSLKSLVILSIYSLYSFSQKIMRTDCFDMNYNNLTNIDKDTCITVNNFCCFASVNYKSPEGDISSKFCIQPNKLLNDTILDIKKTIFEDIHRQVRRNWNSYNLLLNENNTVLEKYKNKTFWCPLNCSNPVYELDGCNNTITEKNYFDETAQNLLSDFFENLNNKPMFDGDNDENSCKNIIDNKCFEADETIESLWKNLEDELNFQYNITQCIKDSCTNSTLFEQVQKENKKFIGRVDYGKEKLFPKECVPVPKKNDLIKVSIVCPKDYIDSLHTLDNMTMIEDT